MLAVRAARWAAGEVSDEESFELEGREHELLERCRDATQTAQEMASLEWQMSAFHAELQSSFLWACSLKTGLDDGISDKRPCRNCGLSHGWHDCWGARCSHRPPSPPVEEPLTPTQLSSSPLSPLPSSPEKELQSAFLTLFGREGGARDPGILRARCGYSCCVKYACLFRRS